MTLETERLLLRPWREEDAASLYKYAKDERIGPTAGWPTHTDVENSREIIRTILSAEETYAICHKDSDEPIGSVGLIIGNRSNLGIAVNEAEVGYWIGVPFWGQGLVTEAVRELIRHAFEDLNIRRLWGGYFDGNTRSQRVFEKCGFEYHHSNENVYWSEMDYIKTEHIMTLKKP